MPVRLYNCCRPEIWIFDSHVLRNVHNISLSVAQQLRCGGFERSPLCSRSAAGYWAMREEGSSPVSKSGKQAVTTCSPHFGGTWPLGFKVVLR